MTAIDDHLRRVPRLVAALRERAEGLRRMLAAPYSPAAPLLDEAADTLEALAAEPTLPPPPTPYPIERGSREECEKNWPGCWNGGYDPRCCRFPKSCSCDPRVPAEDPAP